MQVVLCDCGTESSVYELVCPDCGEEREPRRYRPRRPVLRLLAVLAVSAAVLWGASRLWPRDLGKIRRAAYGAAVRDLRHNRYADAAIHFARYLDEHGEYPPARFLLGVALYRSGRVEAGLAQVRAALDRDPGLAEPAVFLAEVAWEQGRYDEALSWALRALHAEPAPPSAHLLVARLLVRTEFRDLPRAVWHLRRAARSGVEDPDAIFLLAELIVTTRAAAGPGELGPEERSILGWAQDEARSILERRPDRYDLRCFLSRCRLALGDLDAAWREFAPCLSSGVETPEALVLLGRLEWERGHEANATRAFRKVLDSDADPEHILEIAEFYRRAGREDLADRAVQVLRERNSLDVSFLLWEARRLLKAEDLDAAEALLVSARAAHPGEGRFPFLLAETLLARGDRAGAVAIHRVEATRRGPGSRSALRLAELLLATPRGAPHEAERIREAEEILDSKLAAASALRTVLEGRLALRRGDAAGAVELAREAIRRDPSDPRAHRLLAVGMGLMGEHLAAADALGPVLEIEGPSAELLVQRGGAYLLAGRGTLILARRDAERALALEPGRESAEILLARILQAERVPDWDGAREILERAAEREGASVLPRVELGRLHMRRGELAEAERVLLAAKRGVRSREDRAHVFRALADLADEAYGRPLSPEARRLFESFLDDHPGLLDEHVRYAKILLAHGEREAAARRADLVLAAEPRHLGALVVRFETCVTGGEADRDLPRARELLASISDVAAGSGEEAYAAGRLALAEGQVEKAVEKLELARERLPEDPHPGEQLAVAWIRRGRLAEARRVVIGLARRFPDRLPPRLLLSEISYRYAVRHVEAGSPLRATEELEIALDQDPGNVDAAALLVETVFQSGLRGDPWRLHRLRKRCEELISGIAARDPGSPDRDHDLARAYGLLLSGAGRRGTGRPSSPPAMPGSGFGPGTCPRSSRRGSGSSRSAAPASPSRCSKGPSPYARTVSSCSRPSRSRGRGRGRGKTPSPS